jgi:hypothetical protein
LLRGYLGEKVRYDGHVILKLTDRAEESNYVSAEWHHDRCGRRIKAFIFMHDVGMSTRPTLVAARSHNTLFFTYAHPWKVLSRYGDAWVRSQHQVRPMLGSAGGGFVFDTNAMHKGEARGTRSRLVVILEFHAHGKIPVLQALPNPDAQRKPCPSSSAVWPKGRARPRSMKRGMPGLPLFPEERVA